MEMVCLRQGLGHKCLQLFLHGMQGGATQPAAGKNLNPNIATTTATSRQAARFPRPLPFQSPNQPLWTVVSAMSATFTANRLL